MADYSYDAWVRAGKPGGDFSAWQRVQPGYGTTQVAGPGSTPDPNAGNVSGPQNGQNGPASGSGPLAGGGVSPATFDQRLAAGEFAGNEGKATQLEVERRRRLIATNVNGSGGANGGFDTLPPDIADLVLKDASGRVRKARGGSTRSALGQAFNPAAPIGSSSILGDY
jgi:hypothetical protein